MEENRGSAKVLRFPIDQENKDRIAHMRDETGDLVSIANTLTNALSQEIRESNHWAKQLKIVESFRDRDLTKLLSDHIDEPGRFDQLFLTAIAVEYLKRRRASDLEGPTRIGKGPGFERREPSATKDDFDK